MAEPVWGALQKSQIDNETIEQAIARIIQDHEDDANAHIEAGESLETHKAEDVVDHPQSSIVPDKLINKNKYFHTTFDSLDAWTLSVFGSGLKWPGCFIATSAVINEWATLSSVGSGGSPIPYDITKNILFQQTLSVNHGGNGKIYWYFEIAVGGSQLGWYWEDGVLSAYIPWIIAPGTRLVEIDAAFDIWNEHTYRAYIRSADEEVDYYIDGVLVLTQAFQYGIAAAAGQIFFHMWNTENNQARNMYIQELIWASDI